MQFKEKASAAHLMDQVAALVASKANVAVAAAPHARFLTTMLNAPIHVDAAQLSRIRSIDEFVAQLPLSQDGIIAAKTQFVQQSITIHGLAQLAVNVAEVQEYLTSTCHLMPNLAVEVARLVSAMYQSKHTFLDLEGHEF